LRPEAGVAGQAAAALFGSLARLRGDRALHPDGVVLAGTFTSDGTLFGTHRARPALVRLSRGGGLPEALPDVLGCAIRVCHAHGDGRHQDLLLASSLAAPAGRHLLLPGREFGRAFYSSLLPYRVGGGPLLFGARAEGLAGTTFEELAENVRSACPRVRIVAATPLGPWDEVARVELEKVAPHAGHIRFNPWVTGGEIQPAGLLMRLREPAYRASQTVK
jgi:hypothetical protein